MRGEGDKHLRHHGTEAQGKANGQQCGIRSYEGQSEGRRDRPGEDNGDDAPVFDQIAQRSQKHQPARVAQLRERHDGARLRVIQVEFTADHARQWLRIIDVADGQTASHGESNHQPAGENGGR